MQPGVTTRSRRKNTKYLRIMHGEDFVVGATCTARTSARYIGAFKLALLLITPYRIGSNATCAILTFS